MHTLRPPLQAIAAPDMPAAKPRRSTALDDVVVVAAVRGHRKEGTWPEVPAARTGAQEAQLRMPSSD